MQKTFYTEKQTITALLLHYLISSGKNNQQGFAF